MTSFYISTKPQVKTMTASGSFHKSMQKTHIRISWLHNLLTQHINRRLNAAADLQILLFT